MQRIIQILGYPVADNGINLFFIIINFLGKDYIKSWGAKCKIGGGERKRNKRIFFFPLWRRSRLKDILGSCVSSYTFVNRKPSLKVYWFP